MPEQVISAIEAALAKGHRVQLKQMRDGSVKVQIIFQKERREGLIEVSYPILLDNWSLFIL